MKKHLTGLALIALSPLVAAQAPVFEPMPEGSRDAFVGLGLAQRPSYPGSALRRWQLEPVIQMAWSQGLFISGMQAGWHLGDAAGADWPRVEWGPLLALHAARKEGGQGWFVDSPGSVGMVGGSGGISLLSKGQRLQGLDPVPARVAWGGFVNLRWSPQWRLTQSLLSGAGRDRHGTQWRLDLQYALPTLAPHHSLSWTVGAAWANAPYQRSYFGVSAPESERSGHPAYAPRAGFADVHTELRWNWLLSPSWVLSTAMQATRLQGDTARSPLVERTGFFSASSALVLRY